MENLVLEATNGNGEVKKTELSIPASFNWDAVEKASVGLNVAPRYFEFTEVGEKIRGFYLGNSFVEKNEKDTTKKIPVVLIATQSGVVMNGGMSLYDTVTKFCRVGEAIEITYTGQKKTSSGGYLKMYNVTPLIF